MVHYENCCAHYQIKAGYAFICDGVEPPILYPRSATRFHDYVNSIYNFGLVHNGNSVLNFGPRSTSVMSCSVTTIKHY